MQINTGVWYQVSNVNSLFKFNENVTTRGFDPSISAWTWYDLDFGSGSRISSFKIAPSNENVTITKLNYADKQLVASISPVDSNSLFHVEMNGFPDPYVSNVTGYVTNLDVNAFSNNKLIFIVSAPSGTTSTTKIFAGIKGEPTAVYASNGILSWSYNLSTMTLTLNVIHTSPTEIVVDWSARIPGDANGNGKVDVLDLAKLGKAYGCTPNNPNWDPNCDFNQDRSVDIYDLYTLGKNYGKNQT
jgi:hypothetical protein